MHIYIIYIIYTYMCIIVCIGLSTPTFKNTTLNFFAKPPLQGANCPSPLHLFREFPSIHWFFVTPLSPLKIRFSSEPP